MTLWPDTSILVAEVVISNLKTNNAGKFNKPYLSNGNYKFRNVAGLIVGTSQFYMKKFSFGENFLTLLMQAKPLV